MPRDQDATVFHDHVLGLTWVAGDPLRRAGHALADDGRVWLVDPIDDEDLLARARSLGSIAGVIQLFVAHNRDCAALAERLGVPLHKLPDALPGAPFAIVPLDLGPWKERALWWPDRRALIVGESVGTAPHYAVGPGPTGVHMLRRLLPPTALRVFTPEHLLVGHGAPLHGDDAAAGLRYALDHARRDLPRLLTGLPRLIRAMRSPV